MAEVEFNWAKISVGDSARKTWEAAFRVNKTNALAYATAADEAARLATVVGTLLNRAANLMRGSVRSKGVEFEVKTSPFAFPAVSAKVWGTNKFVISHLSGLDAYTQTLPTADLDAVTMESDGITVNTTSTGTDEVKDFITSFNAIVLSKNGTSTSVQKIKVNDE